MTRIIGAVLALFIAILWLPLWVQLGLFCLAVIWAPYRVLLLVPAVCADALYAPTTTFSLGHFKMTMIVGGLLIVRQYIITKTRIGATYVQIRK